MDNAFPKIKILPGGDHFKLEKAGAKLWYKSPRFIIFSISLLLSLSCSLVYVYSRPALFRSYATLLTVAQTAIDQQSREADVQHVAIQSQILGGQELLEDTLARLQQNVNYTENTETNELSIAMLRRMLSVQAIDNTNLVELAASGYNPELTVSLVNTAIDIYLSMRAEEIRQTTGATLEALQQELINLYDKIFVKRSELEEFRKANNITSLNSDNIFENQSLAQLRGLNKAYSDANEAAIKSKAKLEAVNKAIEQGKIVVPDSEKNNIRTLELNLQKLKEQLAHLDKKYTRSYITLDPKFKRIPEQIAELEQQIKKKSRHGRGIVQSEAEQNYEAAQLALIETKKQLEEYQQKANAFGAKVAIGKSLMSDLEGLELLQRSAKERLVQIEARQAEKFPQVKVIERAFLPRDPVSPDYSRDAIIAVIASTLLALFCVWLMEFLTRSSEQKAFISVSDINMYNDSAAVLSNQREQAASLRQSHSQSLQYEQYPDQNSALNYDFPEELNIDDLVLLLEEADNKARQLVCLLLSGLKLNEIVLLKSEDIDFNKDIIHVAGESQRMIILNPLLKILFNSINPCPVWNNDSKSVSEETLSAILTYAAVDAGITEAQKITAQAISHSYIMYLVKQGIRLSELEQVTGFIDVAQLSRYSRFSPQRKGLSITDINLVHPAMEMGLPAYQLV